MSRMWLTGLSFWKYRHLVCGHWWAAGQPASLGFVTTVDVYSKGHPFQMLIMGYKDVEVVLSSRNMIK